MFTDLAMIASLLALLLSFSAASYVLLTRCCPQYEQAAARMQVVNHSEYYQQHYYHHYDHDLEARNARQQQPTTHVGCDGVDRSAYVVGCNGNAGRQVPAVTEVAQQQQPLLDHACRTCQAKERGGRHADDGHDGHGGHAGHDGRNGQRRNGGTHVIETDL